jgi:nicotinate-nucleotide adenylyltransferase
LGVFGGAFDPPHLAHAALIESAMTALQLDQLRVVPTGQAWHKSRPLSPAPHRLAMARLAFAGAAGVVVDPCEIERSGPSYSIDTLRQFKALWPQATLFLILGQDQAKALPGWHASPEIPRIATICIAVRADLTGATTYFHIPQELESCFRWLPMPALALSATDIRARIAEQQSVADMVFEPVARYIALHHLYQTV